MTDELRPLRGFPAVDPAEIPLMREDYLNHFLPIARLAGAVKANEQPSDILRRIAAGIDSKIGEASKRTAVTLVECVTAAVACAQMMQRKTDGDGQWAELLSSIPPIMQHSYGYLSALADVREETIRRGANGRRAIGNKSRAKVLTAGHGFKHKMSKEEAAPKIAEMVKLSTATVRRKLTELFPGPEWPYHGLDESTDKESRNGGSGG